MYIIDIISCTNWLFVLLGSYKTLPCAVQVVFRKELGRVQPLDFRGTPRILDNRCRDHDMTYPLVN